MTGELQNRLAGAERPATASSLLEGLSVRLFSEHDDIAVVTGLLHRAYEPLLREGIPFLAATQDDATTRSRIEARECWLVERYGELLATVTFSAHHQTAGCAWFDRPGVASFGQLAVHPGFQCYGLGGQLLDLVEGRARATGATDLALATAEQASDLIAWYTRRGYRVVDHAHFDPASYRRVIANKAVA